MFNTTLILSLFFLFSACSSSGNRPQELTEDQKNGELYYSYGTDKLVNKDYSGALKYLLQAEEKLPNDARVQNNLAMCYYFKDKKDLALVHLKNSVRLDPKNSDARNNLASVYFEMNRLKEAKATYEEVVQDLTYKGIFRVYHNLGLLALKQNDKESALAHFTKAAEERPDYCPSEYQLGLLHKENRNYPEAIKHLKASTLGECFKEPAPNFEMAMVYILMEDFKKAQAKLENFIKNFPKSPQTSLAEIQLQKVLQKLDTVSNEKLGQSAMNQKSQVDDQDLTQQKPGFRHLNKNRGQHPEAMGPQGP